MRPQSIFIGALAALTACALGVTAYFQLYRVSAPPSTAQAIEGDRPAAEAEQVTAAVNATEAPAVAKAAILNSQAEPLPTAPQAAHQTYVAERVAKLQELAMDDQGSSLQTILGELSNRDPVIRKAAREAAVQFSSRDAIPRLLEAAGQTEDPAEKQELIEAAEFLKLPSLTEVMQQRGIKPVLTAKPAPGKKMPAFTRDVRQAPAPQLPTK